MLTDEEREILELTAALWNRIKSLPVLHVADISETARDIHDIQNRIAARPVIRASLNAKP
jgi:hypothetical protein